MTFEEIKQIPDLQIEVTPIVEDAFYFIQSLEGSISDEAGIKAAERLQSEGYTKDEIRNALVSADKMIGNLKKYGVACAEWI